MFDGTSWHGPMTDYNEWDVESSSSPTISDLGVQFGNMAVKV